MNTVLMPLNTTTFQNSLTYIGEWFSPYFNALLPLGLMIAGFTIAVILIIFIWHILADLFYYVVDTTEHRLDLNHTIKHPKFSGWNNIEDELWDKARYGKNINPLIAAYRNEVMNIDVQREKGIWNFISKAGKRTEYDPQTNYENVYWWNQTQGETKSPYRGRIPAKKTIIQKE